MKDPGIEEIRKARHEISAEHGHDLHAVVEYYRHVERELRASGRFTFEEISPSDRSPGDELPDQSVPTLGAHPLTEIRR
jgi:hypothetical protein